MTVTASQAGARHMGGQDRGAADDPSGANSSLVTTGRKGDRGYSLSVARPMQAAVATFDRDEQNARTCINERSDVGTGIIYMSSRV